MLLIPRPLDQEIDGLRRAAGDGSLGRIPAHCTLVPPVNVAETRLGDALMLLRAAAAATRPFAVDLGPPDTFLPDTPVLHLPVVEGPGLDAIVRLRQRVFVEPLARSLTWPFVPHVTLADDMDSARIAAARAALSDYRVTTTFERLHLLQEGPGRRWEPIADALFAAPAVIGRGGLELEVSVSHRPDPEGSAASAAGWGDGEPLTITGRRGREVVGVASGWVRGGVAVLHTLCVVAAHRGEGIGSHVLAAFASEAAGRGGRRLSARAAAGSDGDRFLRHRGWREEGRLADWIDGEELVHLRRDV